MNKNPWYCPRPNSTASRERSRRCLKWIMAFGAAALLLPIATVMAQNATPAQVGNGNSNSSATNLTGKVDNGKRLFVRDGCYECHGILGQGGAVTGPRLAPNPIPVEAIMSYIRKPSGRMPPFSAKLVQDQDVADIYAYLKSVPGPSDIKNVPLFTK